MTPEEAGRRQDPRTEGPALDPRRVLLIGAGLAAVFGALAVWSLLGDSGGIPEAPTSHEAIGPGSSGPGEEGSTGKSVMPPPPTAESEQSEPIVQGRLLKEPRELPGLLSSQFQRFRSDSRAAFMPLRNILPAVRSVTVINVWATYCEPCKREFPGFSALQAGWGNNVRFVPIQLGEGEARGLHAIMPDAPDHLVDYTPGGAVQAELAKLGELPDNAPIPITLLLDCRQELRWVQQGEVTDMQAFDRAVRVLREELSTPRCAVKTQPVAPSTPILPDPCRHLKCKPDQICAKRNMDGTYHCLDTLR